MNTRLRDLFSWLRFPSHSRTLTLLGLLLIVITAIPLTVYIAQKQQEVRQRAAVLSCIDEFGSPIAKGALCGNGKACDGEGNCSLTPCTEIETCESANPNPCRIPACNTTTQVCEDLGPRERGRNCGTGRACDGQGNCVTSTAGGNCSTSPTSPPNAPKGTTWVWKTERIDYADGYYCGYGYNEAGLCGGLPFVCNNGNWEESGVAEGTTFCQGKCTGSSTNDAQPLGHLDSADCNTFKGWACDPDDFNTPLRIDFYPNQGSANARTSFSVTANEQREEVVGTQCGGNRNHGFTAQTPAALKDGQEYRIVTYGVNIPDLSAVLRWKRLDDPPITIRCNGTHSPTPTVTPNGSATPTPTGSQNTGNTALYIDSPLTTGVKTTVIATGKTTCNQNISKDLKAGLTCPDADFFATCDSSNHNPKDNNPCWWKWSNCTVGNPGNYQATFTANNNTQCNSTKDYVVSSATIPTATPTPTQTPTATPLPTGSTILNLSLNLTGIGDNVDVPGGGIVKGNPNPKTTTRQVEITIINPVSQKELQFTGPVTYNSSTKKFEGKISLGINFAGGDYLVKVKTDKYLKKQIGKGEGQEIQRIAFGQEQNMSAVLIAGDINNDNVIDVRDYNVYIGCFGNKANDSSSCKDKNAIDLNNDEVTDSPANMSDYTLLLYAFAVRNGD